jgi:hypothetical protein
MPPEYAAIPRRWWPCHPPWIVGGEGPLTDADIAEARALYLALDAASQRWYAQARKRLGLPPLPPDEVSP